MNIKKIILLKTMILQPIFMAAFGIHNGALSPCNNRWNCVITQEVDGQKPNAQPIQYVGSRAKALALLKEVLLGFDRVQLVAETDEYIHVTFTTKWLGFVDDVECYAPKNEKIVHIRSASRVGKYDFGVNNRRIQAIKKRFAQLNT